MGDELLIKFLLRETSSDEDRMVEEWIAASPANKKQMADLEIIWTSSKNLAKDSSVDENLAWERFKALSSSPKGKKVVVKPIWGDRHWLKIAAIFVLIAAAWSFYNLLNNTRDTLTATELVLTETLPDGSKITMNRNSKLSYSFPLTEKKRLIKLERGEVFFNVSKDKEKPFIIEVDDATIQVVGTSFNVKHLDNTTEVIVESGVVRVAEGAQTVELRKGQKVLIDAGAKLEVVKSSDQLYNYYRTQEFVADNTPLPRVVEVLNEAYNSNIVIENPRLNNSTLTTTFKKESLDDILRVIAETLDAKVLYEDNKIILK